jgi:phosphohistidine phosphatase SixA
MANRENRRARARDSSQDRWLSHIPSTPSPSSKSAVGPWPSLDRTRSMLAAEELRSLSTLHDYTHDVEMKHVVLIISVFLSVLLTADAAPIVFIVRHAEKAATGGNDPDLSVAGQKRAETLARILKDSQITTVFVTEFKRTQETAAPTARLNPIVVPSNDVAGMAAKVRALDGNALVVGHGNTIPELIKALGITTPIAISENDYSEIFVVLVHDPPQLFRLHYPF